MQPDVSIILPCYNAQDHLDQCLTSILGQTFSNWELIALNDGSTDGTVDILNGVDDDRMRIINDSENKGCPARLNEGIQLATGNYIARMDSDDIMFPDRLERQVELLRKHQEYQLCGAGLVSIDANNNIRGSRCTPEKVTTARRIFEGEVIYHPTVMGRSEWYKENPYLDTFYYCDDYALWTKSAADLNIVNIQEPLLFYREHELFTFDKYHKRVEEMRRAIQEHAPGVISDAETSGLLKKISSKYAVYKILNMMNLWSLSYKLSNRSVSTDEREAYETILADILDLNTEVP